MPKITTTEKPATTTTDSTRTTTTAVPELLTVSEERKITELPASTNTTVSQNITQVTFSYNKSSM